MSDNEFPFSPRVDAILTLAALAANFSRFPLLSGLITLKDQRLAVEKEIVKLSRELKKKAVRVARMEQMAKAKKEGAK